MTDYLRITFCLLGILINHKPLLAAVDCGPRPELTPTSSVEEFKADANGKAQLLTKFLPAAELKGRVELWRSEQHQQYSDVDQQQKDLYFQWVSCQNIMSSSQMTDQERQRQWTEVLQVFRRGSISKDSRALAPLLYPFRDLRVDFEVQIPLATKPLTALRDLVEKKTENPGITGVSILNQDTVLVDTTSPLFPKPGSIARTILDEVVLTVALYGRTASAKPENAGYEYIGMLFIEWTARSSDRAEIGFKDNANYMSLSVEGLRISNVSATNAGLYSLADIVPGAVSVLAEINSDACVHQHYIRYFSDKDCSLLESVSGITVSKLTVHFPYPIKLQIDDDAPAATRCIQSDQEYLVASLPPDIMDLPGVNAAFRRGLVVPKLPCAYSSAG